MNATSNTAGNIALIASGSGGLVTVINEYAVIIGLVLTLASIVIGLIFHIRADRWRAREAIERQEILIFEAERLKRESEK